MPLQMIIMLSSIILIRDYVIWLYDISNYNIWDE
jgi:hypothetical protein